MDNIRIMSLGSIINSIKNKDITAFKVEFSKQILSQVEKQLLLIVIFDEYYDFKKYSFFKKVFDVIIESKINLNFKIENHWGDNLLSFVVSRTPQIQLFDYFIDNGAKLNYVAKPNDKSNSQTCLDFAEMKFYDAVEDNDFLYFSEIKPDFSCVKDDNVCINKSDYEELLRRSNYLKDIYDTYKLLNHIIAIGGKRFAEL